MHLRVAKYGDEGGNASVNERALSLDAARSLTLAFLPQAEYTNLQ